MYFADRYLDCLSQASYLIGDDNTGQAVVVDPGAEAEFQIRSLADGDRITLGQVTLEIMHTPGHTPESISVLVYEHPDDEIAYGVLTGDAVHRRRRATRPARVHRRHRRRTGPSVVRLHPTQADGSARRRARAGLRSAGGWRSSVAASMLRRQGNSDVSDLLGGFAAWIATHQPANA